jgi:hypothetical protein
MEKTMKKICICVMLIVFSAAAFAQQGILQDITGTVELKHPGEAAFTPAKNGDAVEKNTIVSTGFKSQALIVTGTASVYVKPLTRLSFDELARIQGTEQVNISLQAGRVRAEIKPPEGTRSEFTVKSPTATASVRGTEFDFDSFSVRVSEGTVAYSGLSGKPRTVSAGGASTVDTVQGRAADPIETTAAALLPPAPAGSDFITPNAETRETAEPVDFTITLIY